jgi:hypothetical protein
LGLTCGGRLPGRLLETGDTVHLTESDGEHGLLELRLPARSRVYRRVGEWRIWLEEWGYPDGAAVVGR